MDKTTRMLLFSVAGMAIIGVAGTVMIARSGVPKPADTQNFAARPAPDFELRLFSGKQVRLSDFRGKQPVVVNFWASWCPPCRAEAPTLARVSNAYGDRVKFLGVAVNDNPENAKAFLKEFGITYDNGPDPGNAATDYKITGIPETFWIDTKGQIVDHWIGAIEEDELVARTERLISQSAQ